jgi:hypothetical protein
LKKIAKILAPANFVNYIREAVPNSFSNETNEVGTRVGSENLCWLAFAQS